MSNAAVLVIYTGGTLGMVPSDKGLVPGGDMDARLHRCLDTLPDARRAALPSFDTHSLDRLIDSSNATPQDWVSLAALIQTEAVGYQGVVVLHGTDTLAWGSAFLSCLVHETTVVITGAQRPMETPGSDAVHNLELAFQAAVAGCPGVVAAFGDRIFDGTAVRKWSTHADHGFTSPNAAPLANWPASQRHTPLPMWKAFPPAVQAWDISAVRTPNVVRVVVWPGIPASTVEALLANAEGAVLEVWGSGNLPGCPELFRVLIEAAHRNVLMMAISQCPFGALSMNTYAAGQTLLQCGVIDGGARTPEYAFATLYATLLSSPKTLPA